MRTFDRYFIHFMGIGLIVFVVAIILLALDGGELLVPGFLIVLISVYICFAALMTTVSSFMAKPKKVRLKPDDDIIKTLERMALKKWGRKQIIHEENITRFMFGNRYKDWLATKIELIEDKNGYILYLPSVYVEDIIYLCDD